MAILPRARLVASLLILLLLIPAGMALTVKNRSYSDVAKNDPKDMIRTEVGDWRTGNTAANFVPILNISRWDEVWLSIRPTNVWPTSGTVTITVNQTASKITAQRGNIKITFYNLSGIIQDGGYEYEITYSQRPITNILSFSLNQKNIRYEYQDALNIEMNNASCTSTDCVDFSGSLVHRPEKIVGSYAIFGMGKWGDWSAVNGKNYQTGKVAHIYRPQIYDSGKNTTWGTLNITGNILNLTIDSKWLDQAVYPITVDPPFGYSTMGSSSVGSGSTFLRGSDVKCSETGNIVAIVAGLSGSGSWDATTANGLYLSSDSSYIIGSGSTLKNFTTTATWYSINITSTAVTNGVNYTLLNWGNWGPSPGSGYWYYDSGGKGGYSQATFPTWPNPFSWASEDTYQYSIYGIYSTGGAAAPVAMFNLTALGNLISPGGYNSTHRNQTLTMTFTGTCDSCTSYLYYPSGSRLPTWLNSTLQNPTFFPKGIGGRYTLCLMATNAGGSDTKCGTFYVSKPGNGG